MDGGLGDTIGPQDAHRMTGKKHSCLPSIPKYPQTWTHRICTSENSDRFQPGFVSIMGKVVFGDPKLDPKSRCWLLPGIGPCYRTETSAVAVLAAFTASGV
jgi:hypothetical protein